MTFIYFLLILNFFVVVIRLLSSQSFFLISLFSHIYSDSFVFFPLGKALASLSRLPVGLRRMDSCKNVNLFLFSPFHFCTIFDTHTCAAYKLF